MVVSKSHMSNSIKMSASMTSIRIRIIRMSHDVVKRWCCEFKCGRQFCEDEQQGGAATTTTRENVKKLHCLVLQDF